MDCNGSWFILKDLLGFWGIFRNLEGFLLKKDQNWALETLYKVGVWTNQSPIWPQFWSVWETWKQYLNKTIQSTKKWLNVRMGQNFGYTDALRDVIAFKNRDSITLTNEYAFI